MEASTAHDHRWVAKRLYQLVTALDGLTTAEQAKLIEDTAEGIAVDIVLNTDNACKAARIPLHDALVQCQYRSKELERQLGIHRSTGLLRWR